MDIFTTQLTRVVPVPIKPASLKVKALLKDAANTKLSQDPDHLENHEYYFTREKDEYCDAHPETEQEASQDQPKKEEPKDIDITYDRVASDQKKEQVGVEKTSDDNKDDTKHLDLYA